MQTHSRHIHISQYLGIIITQTHSDTSVIWVSAGQNSMNLLNFHNCFILKVCILCQILIIEITAKMVCKMCWLWRCDSCVLLSQCSDVLHECDDVIVVFCRANVQTYYTKVRSTYYGLCGWSTCTKYRYVLETLSVIFSSNLSYVTWYQ